MAQISIDFDLVSRFAMLHRDVGASLQSHRYVFRADANHIDQVVAAFRLARPVEPFAAAMSEADTHAAKAAETLANMSTRVLNHVRTSRAADTDFSWGAASQAAFALLAAPFGVVALHAVSGQFGQHPKTTRTSVPTTHAEAQHDLLPVLAGNQALNGPFDFRNSLVAVKAEAEIGLDWKDTSHQGHGGYSEPGACMVAAARWLKLASGGNRDAVWPYDGSDPLATYHKAGATPIGVSQAQRGDLLQLSIPSDRLRTGQSNWDNVHTAVVLENNGDGTFKIAESNYDNQGDARIIDHWSPSPRDNAIWTAWRFGQFP